MLNRALACTTVENLLDIKIVDDSFVFTGVSDQNLSCK